MKLILALVLSGWSFTAFAGWKVFANGFLDQDSNLFITRTLTGNTAHQLADQRCVDDGFRLPTWDEMQFARVNGIAALKRQNGDDPTWWFWTAEGRRFSLEGFHIPGNEAKTVCASN